MATPTKEGEKMAWFRKSVLLAGVLFFASSWGIFADDREPDWGTIGGSSGRSRAHCKFAIVDENGMAKRVFKLYAHGPSYYSAQKIACRKSLRRCKMYLSSKEGLSCQRWYL